jgi:GWxTD domain-containing protein
MRLAVLVLSIATITPVFASGPKFKEWEKSPQAYFMTQVERQEWNAVKTPEEAQQFIDKFVARRGPNFAAEVADRAAKADKYMTLGKLPGSQTLRGKTIVLLGPPSNMELNDVTDSSSIHRDNPETAGAYSGGGGASTDRSAGGNVDSNEGGRTMGFSNIIRNYHLTYASTPAGPIDVTISADPNTGKDRPRGRDDSKRLDAAFEAAAQASIKSK